MPRTAPLLASLALATTVVFSLSGCGSSPTGSNQSTPAAPSSATQTSPASPAATPATPALTIDNDGVDSAAYDKLLAQFPAESAASVVTTSVPLAEVMHTLAIPVIGVPSSTTVKLPAELEKLPKVGNAMAPDVEQIVKLAPKLVVSAEASRSTIEKSLADTKIKSAFLKTDNLADLKLAVKVLGTAFDKPAEAKAAMETILAQENALLAHKGSAKPLKVLVLIGTSDSFMVMNNKSFVGSLLETAGADNVAVSQFKATETYSAVDLEAVVAAAPDAVFVLQSGSRAEAQAAFDKEVEKNPAWKSLPASTNKKITVLDYQVFGTGTLAGIRPAVTTLLPALAS